MYTEDCTAAELACIFTAAPSECSKELQRDEIGGYQGMILSEQLTTLGPQFAFLLKAIHSCTKLLILQLMHQVLKEPWILPWQLQQATQLAHTNMHCQERRSPSHLHDPKGNCGLLQTW